MTTQKPTLDSSTVAMRLGMCAAALAGTAATVTDAQAVVVTFSTPINIPNTTAGVYINLLTGATGLSGSSTPGWDFNPYLANYGTQLGFYWSPTLPTTGAPRAGGVALTAATGPYLDLPVGTTISSASTFTSGITATTGSPYLTPGTYTLGFRFYNAASPIALNYGYLSMTIGGTTGFPATINRWSYENTGAAITVTAVPEPATALMLSAGALALGAVNLRRLRRARRQTAH